MTEQLTAREIRAWRTYLSASVQLMERLDHELQQRSQLTLTDFEILFALSEASGRRLRMSELAADVLVSRSRLTYRVDRLVEVGFVTREECEDDRRGLWAILTELGHQSMIAAQPGHHGDIRHWFFDHMDESELYAVERTVTRVEEKLGKNR